MIVQKLSASRPSSKRAYASNPRSVVRHTITDSDANIAAFLKDLTLTRTYNSRDTSPRTSDMFGPGWTSGFDTDGGEMRYRRIYNYSKIDETTVLAGYSVKPTDAFFDSAVIIDTVGPDGEPLIDALYNWDLLAVTPRFKPEKFERKYAVVELNDGRKVSFEKIGDDWFPETEFATISLRTHGEKLIVEDEKGQTTFDKAGLADYYPASFAQRGSNSNVTFAYVPYEGRMRLRRIIAPVVGSATCDNDTWSNKCRALELDWKNDVPVGSKTEPRVIGLALRAYAAGGSPSSGMVTVRGYRYDSQGRLQSVIDPRSSSGLATTYSYNSDGRLASYGPPGERPWTFAYQATDPGKLRSSTRKTPAGTDATTTVVYDVPVSGSSAPYDLSQTTIATWGQDDVPRTATAVFPPDAVRSGSGMPSSWARAKVNYIGSHGKVTNLVDGAGNIETKEYNDLGLIRRELSPRNRERALAVSGSTAARARELDTTYHYASNDFDVERVLGPEQEFRRPDGSTVLGRKRTVMAYDEGKPSGSAYAGDQHLVTTASIGTRRSSDGVILDEKTTTYEYSIGASNDLGWKYGKPLKVTVGSGGETQSTHYAYHVNYPLLTARFGTRFDFTSLNDYVGFTYYGVDSGVCATSTPQREAYSGAPCEVRPVDISVEMKRKAQRFDAYDPYWNQGLVSEFRVAPLLSGQPDVLIRATARNFDMLGREYYKAAWAASGNAVPNTSTIYSATTGRPTTTTSATGSTIQRAYDDNGRISSYTDAIGTTTSTTYDINGRVQTVAETNGSTNYGTRGNVYDDRDRVTSVVDSKLPGPINAVRDADGNVTSQTLPGGIRVRQSLNHVGAVSSKTWERTTGCTGSACTLSESSVERDAQDRIAGLQSDQSATSVSYDSVGRVNGEDATRNGVCVRTRFTFDLHSNRTSRSTNTSPASGACGSGSTSTTNNVYDVNDRIINSGTVYDDLGRTTTVPAADSPQGAGVTTLTYDADDLVASIGNNTVNQTIQRDPLRRLWWVSTTGSSSSFGAMRYAGDGDSPSGKSGATWWERYVQDVDGGQVGVVTDQGNATWQLSDIQGNIVASQPASGTAPTGRTEYGSFLTRAWTTGTWTPTGHPGVVHAALGRYGMQTAGAPGGFIHMGARVYNPVTGRFLQPDPILDGSANDYDYCNQDPYNCLDLDGRKAFDVVLKLNRVGMQLGRGASLWIANAYVSQGAGAAGAAICVAARAHWATAFMCGTVAAGLGSTITNAIIKEIFRNNQCLEFGMAFKRAVKWVPVWTWNPYTKTTNCRSV